MGEAGVNFAWCRNQCIDRCTSDWIFMTEGHEYLLHGKDALLNLQIMPKEALIGFVARQMNNHQWAFPWLFRRDSRVRFKRPTHNVLDYPPKALAVKFPQVVTHHERIHTRSTEREAQRRVQNRKHLMEDWADTGNLHSLYYLAQEWGGIDDDRSMERYAEFIQKCNNGVPKYQARLVLGRYLYQQGKIDEARAMFHAATADDWSRGEHWLSLGDIAFEQDQLEQARQFYLYAASHIGDPPFVTWWLQEACAWAEKAAELLPNDSPASVIEEAHANIRLLKETLENGNN
jgi:tetratricopeptide (TPR) repeat protein